MRLVRTTSNDTGGSLLDLIRALEHALLDWGTEDDWRVLDSEGKGDHSRDDESEGTETITGGFVV